MTTLVFLESHDGELTKGALGVLGKAASLGGDVAGVVLGSGVRDAAAAAGAFGASAVYVVDDEALAAPLPQPRVDALQAVVRESGADTVLFAASVLAADVAAGLAARLEAGLNWDLTDLRVEGDALVGVRPALGDTVLVEVGWSSTPRLALIRAGTFDPVESGGSAEVKDVTSEFHEFSTRARLVEHLTEKASGPSIEDAVRCWIARISPAESTPRTSSTIAAVGSFASRLKRSRSGRTRCTRAAFTRASEEIVRASSPSSALT